MKKRINRITFALFTLFFLVTVGFMDINSHDKLKWLEKYNIVWESDSKNSSESMPVGGGDIGCNVWVENGDILFYIQRSGSLSENGEYLKLGRIRIKLTPNPFENSSLFRQKLILKDGYIEIEATGSKKITSAKAKINVWTEISKPVIHVDINTDKPVEVTAAFESWRTEDRELPDSERFGCFSLEGYPGKVIKTRDIIENIERGVLFYHRNPENKLIPDLLIKQQGLEAIKDLIPDDIKNRTFGGLLYGKGFIPAGSGAGKYVLTPYKSWILKSKKASEKHQLLIATHIDQAKTVDEWKTKLINIADSAELNSNKSFDNAVNWWHKFWERSFIVISPENTDPKDPTWQMGRNYQLFRYQLGCNTYGEYPTKFNGGNLTFDPYLVTDKNPYDPDWRAWGGDVFTAQNQRLIYWPMLKSGDFDAILPQFELYRKGLPGATAKVKTHFGHEGAAYSEYTSVPGVDLGAGWGWTDGTHRKRGVELPFGDTAINGLGGYDKPVEQGVMANPSISYHWESQIEHAYMILEYNRFTGADISKYIPFIKSALIFFDNHYQIRQKMRNGKTLDENGKLVIYPSTSCESYRGAKNPSDIIAGLKACLESILKLDEKYISESEKIYYAGFLNRIPDLPFVEVDGTAIINPAYEWLKESNQELPQFYPLFPFNRFKQGDKEIQIFKNTYQGAPAFRKGKVISWHQDGIFFARMGMAKEAADYNTKKLHNSERRFPTFWGPGHDWVPDHNWGGSGMIGLQEMLMQTIGEQIILFPAWPKEWDVDFKLHAPQNTIVECVLKNGKITRLKVFPESRSKDVVVHHYDEFK
jgi:hypothetical protein